jgi:hypothetical protein
MNTNIDYFKSLIGDELYKTIYELYMKVQKKEEFELIITNIDNKYFGQEKYIQLLKYFKYKSTQLKSNIVIKDTLDINYKANDSDIYRIVLVGESINDYIKKLDLWKAHVIFKTLVGFVKNKRKDNIQLIKKIKSKDNTIDISDLFEKVRLSYEHKFTTEDFNTIDNINYKDIDKINFRLKQRTSLYLIDNDKETLKVDLTMIKKAANYKDLNTMYPNFELEIEYELKDGKPSKQTFDTFISESITLHKIIQQSNFLITKSLTDNVIEFYKNIANVSQQSTFLDARQSVSLEIQYVTENIPNKYAVTDKADGDRYFLIIKNKHVYLISTNLVVKDTGIELKTSDYDGTILDGEYIFIPKINRHIFLIFDALFIGSKDIRNITEFMTRIKQAQEVCNKIFVLGNQIGYTPSPYKAPETFNLKDLVDYHRKEITKMMDNLNNDIAIEKQYILIRTKYFCDSTGATPWDIFAFSDLMWKLYTKETNCPYMLDGLIFQPLQQQYVTNMRESKAFEYKWKPPEKNSIDFYIQFEKDKNTGKVLDVYDNSNDDYVRNKPYRICKLYVGRYNTTNNKEAPELFLEDKGVYWAYLFLTDGEVRDEAGNIIQDNSVVEFYYDNTQGEDTLIPEKFRWKPIRTRYDKTESVLKYGKKYGNNAEIAFKIWRSILTPVLMSDISELAIGNDPEKNKFYYDFKIEKLRKKIGHELIILASKQNAYYQKISNLAKPMREFHNWIKSNLVYTYCNKQYNRDQQVSILDMGVGRGGDILRYYYVNAAFVVGLDIAKDGLYSAIDGAISRYNQQRKRKPNFPRMHFIHADCGTKLNYEDQNKVLGGMHNENKKLIEQFFGKNPTKFDRISCQMAMHYFLANKTVWENFKYNINQTLKPGGYFIVTHLDAEEVLKLLGNKNNYEMNYTDDKGKTEKLYEIVKKFDKLERPIGLNAAIDLFAAWMFESGTYVTEYLVDIKFIEQEFLKDCNMELVETELFRNQYNIHNDFFTEAYKYQSNKETLQFLEKVSHYYDDTEINKACYNFSFLHRYSIFRKKDVTESQSINSKMARNIINDNNDNISDEINDDINFEAIKLSRSKYDKDYSFMNSLHYILQQHKIIPKSISVNDFYEENDIKMLKDKDLTPTKMKSLAKKLKIEHKMEDGKTYNVIDGINIDVVKNNKLTRYIDNKKDKTVLMIEESGTYKPVFTQNKDGLKQSLYKINDELFSKF